MMFRPLRVALLALVLGSVADERTELPPCLADKPVPRPPGRVVRLFELHKDRNPQNVLIVHTYVDSKCRLIGSLARKNLLVDMYWRMDARSPKACYKPTDPRIKSETLETLEVTSLSTDRKRLRIEITALDQLRHDLPTREVEVTLRRARRGCEAEARLPLDASRASVLRLREINAKGEYVLGVPLRGVRELELVGRDEGNRPVRRVYRSR